MSESFNPAPILAPRLDSRAITISSNSVANIPPSFESFGCSRPLYIPGNLPYKRWYFGFVVLGVQALELRSRVVFTNQGQPALTIPVNITGFDSGDVSVADDALVPCFDVDVLSSDYSTGRNYGENVSNRIGRGGADCLRFDATEAASDSGGGSASIYQTYRFTLYPVRLALVADAVQWQLVSFDGTIIGSQVSVIGAMGVLSSGSPY